MEDLLRVMDNGHGGKGSGKSVLAAHDDEDHDDIYIYIYIYISPGDNTPQDANCTATCLPSRKLYRSDEPDTPDTAGEAKTSS